VTLTRLVGRCAVLLLTATVVFAAGVALERGSADSHSETTPHAETGAEGHSEESNEESNAETQGEGVGTDAPGTRTATGPESRTLLGVDLESPAVVGSGVAASLLVALALWRRPSLAVVLVTTVFCSGFAALDGREALHQMDEGRDALIAVALLAMLLHLAAAAVAAAALRPLRQAGGSTA
jgi:hypothetical protein